jgi:predicted tellurium resistance membrane protein TerC
MTLKLLQKGDEKSQAQVGQFVYYLCGALLCGGAIWGLKGFQAAEEYFAGYLLEQSLSVDNLFVFMLCFSFFKTPVELQDRVLNIGIWSAAILRLIMILAGIELVENFKPILLVFAAILLYSSFGLLFVEDNDEEEDLSENFIVKAINKVCTCSSSFLPRRTPFSLT